MPASVMRALRRLNRPALQVAEAIAALGGQTGVAVLARLVGNPDRATLIAAIQDLTGSAVVTRHGDDLVLSPAAGHAFGRPLGLGVPVVEMLAPRTSEELKGVARNLALPVAARKTEALAAVTAALRDPRTVRTIVAGAPPEARDLLTRVAHTGEEVDFYELAMHSFRAPPGQASPERWAFERGLLMRNGWEYTLTMPPGWGRPGRLA